MKLVSTFLIAALCVGAAGVFASDDAPKAAAPGVAEPLDLSNLAAVTAALRSLYLDPSAVTDQKLDEAAARGMIGCLGIGARVLDAKSAARKNGTPDIAKTEMLADKIFYIRLGVLGHGTAKALDAALAPVPCGTLNGIILDLRFVRGGDFADAADIAGRLLPKGVQLFTLTGAKRAARNFSTSFDTGCTVTPLIVLINRETAGSAEAVAAAFENQQRAVLIGGTTAGEAVERVELPLKGGGKLGLAVAEIVMPGGKKIFQRGLEPDVPVKADLALERKLLMGPDAQKNLRESLEPKVTKHRINEAELVRTLGPGGNKPEAKPVPEDKDTRNENVKVEQPPDVALSRALDILKGLRILRRG
jgi:Peptidase family S41